jgi:hypothetical protein
MFTPAPAAALTPAAPPDPTIPVPPPSFGGPGGCTTVTPDGGMLCLWVDEDPARRPLFVKTVRGTFTAPNSSTVRACDTHYELSYYRGGVQRTDHADQFGCLPSNNHPDSADFVLDAPLDYDKPICVRTRNAQTDDDWTQPTCVTIHRDSAEVGDI